jgi:predicted SprT family Zn-dependent metalloprotease
MSWETDWIKEYPCPCGNGKYQEESRSDDWNRQESIYTMLCKDCKEKYYYNYEVISGHPLNFREKGWTLKK